MRFTSEVAYLAVRALAEKLEAGAFDGVLARAAERVWAELAAPRLVKRLAWRDGARVVAIGGATLGGSGKTPLAIACARALAARGRRVAIVGHAYRASPGRARVVRADDDVRAVGDEALLCARETAALGVVTVVAPTRQAALDLALSRADVAVLDGVHQCAPRRASLALLAVDPRAPWGASACPPRGDLRAPREALVALADRVVPVRAESRGAWKHSGDGDGGGDGALVGWDELRAARVGLVTALARPSRVVALLAAHGVRPVEVRTFCDHTGARIPPGRTVSTRDAPDYWLTTAKCAASLRFRGARSPGAVAILDHRVTVPAELMTELDPECLDPHRGPVIPSIHPRFFA